MDETHPETAETLPRHINVIEDLPNPPPVIIHIIDGPPKRKMQQQTLDHLVYPIASSGECALDQGTTFNIDDDDVVIVPPPSRPTTRPRNAYETQEKAKWLRKLKSRYVYSILTYVC